MDLKHILQHDENTQQMDHQIKDEKENDKHAINNTIPFHSTKEDIDRDMLLKQFFIFKGLYEKLKPFMNQDQLQLINEKITILLRREQQLKQLIPEN